jgi:hypothetical protein
MGMQRSTQNIFIAIVITLMIYVLSATFGTAFDAMGASFTNVASGLVAISPTWRGIVVGVLANWPTYFKTEIIAYILVWVWCFASIILENPSQKPVRY